MTNMFEGDTETPWLTSAELHQLGFSMILYPTTILTDLPYWSEIENTSQSATDTEK